MELKKSKTGKALIRLFYVAFGMGAFVLMMLMMLKVGILAGLAVTFALSIICGIIGGELEFIEHRRTRRKEHGTEPRKERRSAGKQKKILTFKL